MDNYINHMQLIFDAKSVNEGFARMAVTAFIAELDPTLEEIADVKTAVSEAVTNAIVHGYCDEDKSVVLKCEAKGRTISIIVEDFGVGIEDVENAMQPFYTSKPDAERSGMGFSFMEAFMDDLKVESEPGKGTKVTMKKTMKGNCGE